MWCKTDSLWQHHVQLWRSIVAAGCRNCSVDAVLGESRLSIRRLYDRQVALIFTVNGRLTSLHAGKGAVSIIRVHLTQSNFWIVLKRWYKEQQVEASILLVTIRGSSCSE